MAIGRLEKQDIRSIWPLEDRDFTPWLARPENLNELAVALDLGSLDQIEEEVPVGSFRADITCRDEDGRVVVIENQFGVSDHRHLGQIMTYLAGRKAHTVVWVTEHLRQEHRAAIEWLNAHTDEGYWFFGVEIEAWRIGDSAAAPKFEVIERPNDWVKSQRRRIVAAAEDAHRRIDYWAALLDRLPRDWPLRMPGAAPNQGWMMAVFTGQERLEIYNCGIYVYRNVAKKRIGAYLSLGQFPEVDFADWSARHADLDAFEGVEWSVGNRGYWQLLLSEPGDPLDESDWSRQHDWMIEAMRRFHSIWLEHLRDPLSQLID
ncbi:hypothetical protein [Pukyongiella litopenaei]|uniref:DUF4268 domain-containing protein n=1 Tax=Pukyongiella litopenaei TaxID=2605946 RepID=A0A2S0MME4_9RHOB|nr:hypothetical protein [Pukyongiella litopenaei]AVO37054.1 hypothetical protein C6Y53_04605 [Pukyongiella litopenaei]